MGEIKYDKVPTPAGRQTRTIPLNAATNGQQLNELRSIFVRVPSEHCQLTARIDGIDRDFLFGNARGTRARPRLQPLPLAIGGHTGKQGFSPLIY